MSFNFVKRKAEWKGFERALNPQVFDRVTRKHIRRATALNAKLVLRAMRKAIQSGEFEPNKPLTVAIKGSSKPLVDFGHSLFQALTDRLIDDFTAFVGIQRKDEFYNIGLFLHEGGALPVTPKMRGLFYLLWLASNEAIDPGELTGRAAELWERMPGGWFPIGKGTQAIMITGRPFVDRALEDPDLRSRSKRNWEGALRAALAEIAEKNRRGKR